MSAGLPRSLREAAVGAGLALVVGPALPGGPVRWDRANHRGTTVSLRSGPAVAAGAALSGTPAAAVAGLLSGAVGAYDDVVGARPGQRRSKGFRGHLAALREGTVTAGLVKVGAIGATGLVSAVVAGHRRPRDVVVAGGLVAGCANLLNLLDLRPGRALKVGLVAAAALRVPGPAAAAAVLLPADLGERTMLGDAGANALGAVLGVALADRLATPAARSRALLAVAGLTAASEVVSYSRVIDAVPPLAWLDGLGRRA